MILPSGQLVLRFARQPSAFASPPFPQARSVVFGWAVSIYFHFMPEALTATACLKRLRLNLSEDVAKRKPRKKNTFIAGAQSGLDDEVGAAPKGLNVSNAV
jgi:hypothetical protein